MSIAAKAALPIAIGNAGAIAASFSKRNKNRAKEKREKEFIVKIW